MYLLAPIALPITDPVFIFALVMSIILVAPLVFERLRIPGIVGLILAGVLVGPNLSGVLARDQTIELLGTVGLLYIMFVAGLDINLTQFTKYRYRSLVFGALTFAIPQATGTLLAAYLFGFSWTAAILLGSMFASHTLLAYPIASRLGIGKSEAVTTAVGGTIATDTAALMVLVVIARSVQGELDAAFWIRLSGALVIFACLVFWALPRVGRWFFRRQPAASSSEFVFVLAALFISAMLSKFAGMEPIIGAFMAGLALNRLIPEQSVLMNRIQFVGSALFIPFFLLSVGMLVDLKIFTAGPQAWLMSGFMATTVIATKFGAAHATRRIFRYSKEEGHVIFGLSLAQAAATLAAVVVGFELGILDEAVLNGTIFMILVTCLISPWIVEQYGRKVALAADRTPVRMGAGRQRILVPLANPATAASLMDVALMIRHRDSREPVYPLVVVSDDPEVEAHVLASEKLLGHAVAHAAAADVPVHPATRVDMNVADGIARAMRERRITDVVIGWNGEVSAGERIFGSVVDQMLAETRTTTLVCKVEGRLNTIERILLLAPPLSEREKGFESAVGVVASLADQLGAEVVIAAPRNVRIAVERAIPPGRLRVRHEDAEPAEVVLAHLERIAGPNDLIVALSAREGAISWRPFLDRLPRMIAQHVPTVDFVIIYPPESLPESTEAALLSPGHSARRAADYSDVQYIVVDEHERDGEAIVGKLLQTLFGSRRDLIEPMRARIGAASNEYRHELRKGVVFLHAVSEDVFGSVLCIGISRHGVRFPSSSGPVRVVLLVVNPADGHTRTHLQILASVARIAGDGDTLRRLIQSRTAEEAYAVLLDADRAESPGL